MYDHALGGGVVPKSWKATIFARMFPQGAGSLRTCGFRAAAKSKLFYNVFFLLLGRSGASLEICQRENRRGFRPNKRLEEHLVTAKIFFLTRRKKSSMDRQFGFIQSI